MHAGPGYYGYPSGSVPAGRKRPLRRQESICRVDPFLYRNRFFRLQIRQDRVRKQGQSFLQHGADLQHGAEHPRIFLVDLNAYCYKVCTAGVTCGFDCLERLTGPADQRFMA